MIKYIVKRLIIGLITLFVLTTVTFYLTRLMPGNPFQTENITATMLETITAHYGLDKPSVSSTFSISRIFSREILACPIRNRAYRSMILLQPAFL